MGHWVRGAVGRARKGALDPGSDPALRRDRDIPGNPWWAKSQDGPGNGVHTNDALPINPAPLVGGRNWNANVATLRKM